MLSIVGWHDNFLKSHFDLYRATAPARPAPPRRRARGSTRTTSRRSRRAAPGAVEFGPAAACRRRALDAARCSTGSTAGSRAATPAPRAASATGSSERTSGARPTPGRRRTQSSAGTSARAAARTRGDGDGVLAPDPAAGDEPADSYLYDPLDPVPTVGGKTLMPTILTAGIEDQGEVEDRAGRALLHLAGPDGARRRARARPGRGVGGVLRGRHRLHREARRRAAGRLARSTSPTGSCAARYRESPRRRSAPLAPGEPTAVLDRPVGPRAHLPARATGSGSRSARATSLASTGTRTPATSSGRTGRATSLTAAQQVFHDADHPSALVLPVAIVGRRADRVIVAPEIAEGFDAVIAGAGDMERHAFFARCRDEAPIFFSDALGAWVLTRYDDVRAVLEDDGYRTLTGRPGRADLRPLDAAVGGRGAQQEERARRQADPLAARGEGVDRRQGGGDRPAHGGRAAARRARRPARRLRDGDSVCS